MGNFKPSHDLSQHDMGSDVGYLTGMFLEHFEKAFC